MNKIEIILKEKEFPHLAIKDNIKVLIDENISWEGFPYSGLTTFCPIEGPSRRRRIPSCISGLT